MTNIPSIVIAHRNARTIKWLFGLPVETQMNIASLYAGHLGCHVSEVVLEAETLDNDELGWIYDTFRKQIDFNS